MFNLHTSLSLYVLFAAAADILMDKMWINELQIFILILIYFYFLLLPYTVLINVQCVELCCSGIIQLKTISSDFREVYNIIIPSLEFTNLSTHIDLFHDRPHII